MLNNYKTSTNVNPFKNLFTKEDEREVQNQIGNIAFWVPKEWGDREKTINQFAKDVVNRKISELGERSGQEIPSGFELDVKLKSGEDPSELSSYQVRLSGNQFSATTTLDRLVEGLKNASAPQTSSAVNYSATSASNTLPPNPKTGVDQTYGAKSGNLFDWFKKFFTVDKTDDFYDIGDLWNDVTGWFKGGKKKNDSKSTSSATTSSSSSSPAVSSQSSSASSSKASSVAASSDSASSGAKNLTKTADELIYQEYQEYQKAKEDDEWAIARIKYPTESYYWLGRAELELGNKDEAVRHLQRAVERISEDPLLSDVTLEEAQYWLDKALGETNP